jgi:hypothetical protein
MNLKYETLEKLPVRRPVDRLDFIADSCVGKVVLDIGCFDEIALVKRETQYWLHGRLAAKAKLVVGVDNSNKIPPEGLSTAANATIYRGDGVHVDESLSGRNDYEVIVAGEFIEHIENPLEFFREMKTRFAGRELIISTPNGVSFANTLLDMTGREVQHHDHLHNFTFKILNTLCLRTGFKGWEIIPYRFYATEMILNSSGVKRVFVTLVERSIRVVERLFPLLSFGYILRISL